MSHICEYKDTYVNRVSYYTIDWLDKMRLNNTKNHYIGGM